MGPARKLTWRAGPAGGCDAALRPRGRAAQGPRKAQVARTRGRRPCGSMQTPVRGSTWQEAMRVDADAREGLHVAEGMAGEGPTG